MKEIDQFKYDMRNNSLSFVVSKYILENRPVIFNDDNDFIKWKEAFSQLIGIDGKDLCFVGSSAIGFSLNPAKNFKEFSIESDIDIAVVSDHFFELGWFKLRNLGTDYYSLNQKEKNSVNDHKSRLIFWGTIATDKILHLMPFGKKWIEAISEIRKETGISNDINLRIYKDYKSLRLYQIDSLKKLKSDLFSEGPNEEIIE